MRLIFTAAAPVPSLPDMSKIPSMLKEIYEILRK